MDCICCGFGAVLLLFILTAKKQSDTQTESVLKSIEAAEALQEAIDNTRAENDLLEQALDRIGPQAIADAEKLRKLEQEFAEVAAAVANQENTLKAIRTETTELDKPGALDRPSAEKKYLNGLHLDGPRTVILLENSGSMLATQASQAVEYLNTGKSASSPKWNRAKAAVRAVLAALPRGTQVALLQMNQSADPFSGTPSRPYIDPYDNQALLDTLDRLDSLEASGGADLYRGLRAVNGLPQRPSSLLIISDGLPTAPAKGALLTEKDRIALFNLALAIPLSFPVNTLLLPFEGDPSAAGLYWKLSTRSGGITLVPDADWPASSKQ